MRVRNKKTRRRRWMNVSYSSPALFLSSGRQKTYSSKITKQQPTSLGLISLTILLAQAFCSPICRIVVLLGNSGRERERVRVRTYFLSIRLQFYKLGGGCEYVLLHPTVISPPGVGLFVCHWSCCWIKREETFDIREAEWVCLWVCAANNLSVCHKWGNETEEIRTCAFIPLFLHDWMWPIDLEEEGLFFKGLFEG